LESRLLLDGSGFAGNAFAPDLDLAMIGVQSVDVGEAFSLDLYVAGATVTDLNADGGPTGDTVRLQLDPDDTPVGATLTTDGLFRWTPADDQTGTIEFVIIAVDEGDPPLADAEVLVVEVSENSPPDLAAISDIQASFDELLAIPLSATDPDGDNLTFILDRDDPDSTVPDGATLEQSDNNTAVIRWTPDTTDGLGDFAFPVLVIDDGFPPLSDREVFNVSVAAPLAADDACNVAVDGVLVVEENAGVLANDSGSDTLNAVVVTDPVHGSVTLDPDGSFTYTPNMEFHGTDAFTYEATDSASASSEAVVTITVNTPAVAAGEIYTATEDTALTIDKAAGVLVNDTDTDGDNLTAVLTYSPANGVLMLNLDGSFTYTPEADFNSIDSFTYAANDGFDDSAEVTVTLSVNSVNDAPLAAADAYTTAEDTTLIVSDVSGVLANDTDVDGDSLTAVLVDSPVNGTLALQSDGSFTYTPDADFSGTDSFTYSTDDGVALTEATTVIINVTEQNSFTVDENSAEGTVMGQVTPEGELGDTLIFEVDDPAVTDELKLAADDHLSGDPAAPVVLIEYLDFQCPPCATEHMFLDELAQDFDGDLLIARRHFPLTSIHANAFAAAIASEAAGRQGMFDEMADLLFTNQDEWETAADPTSFFETHATQLGLDLDQFRDDVADPEVEVRVTRDMDAAATLGVPGTPAFYLNGQQITNPATVDDFADLIEAELDSLDDVFAIDRQTGEITVADSAALDFETSPTQTLNVNVTNVDGVRESLVVTINLNDQAEGEGEASSEVSSDQVFGEDDDWLPI